MPWLFRSSSRISETSSPLGIISAKQNRLRNIVVVELVSVVVVGIAVAVLVGNACATAAYAGIEEVASAGSVVPAAAAGYLAYSDPL
mmetsp:Transcript_89317/g.232855  ORF Transcript_89317/g.232855 Transcript_89317/m.232855 type:complete len:87 (-) Transcript_89317:388-648(-)